jgi:hypothetical protein
VSASPRYWEARAAVLAELVAEHRRHRLALADLLPDDCLWALATPAEVLETLARQLDVDEELRAGAALAEADVETELASVWRRLEPRS